MSSTSSCLAQGEIRLSLSSAFYCVWYVFGGKGSIILEPGYLHGELPSLSSAIFLLEFDDGRGGRELVFIPVPLRLLGDLHVSSPFMAWAQPSGLLPELGHLAMDGVSSTIDELGCSQSSTLHEVPCLSLIVVGARRWWSLTLWLSSAIHVHHAAVIMFGSLPMLGFFICSASWSPALMHGKASYIA
ncbi:hypothetical protein Dimus_005123 [Dionaea muscipula]